MSSIVEAWNLRCTSSAEGRLSRKRFIVRLGRCEGVRSWAFMLKGEVFTVMELKSKNPLLPGRAGEENAELPEKEDSSESERFRLRTMVGGATRERSSQYWC